MERGVIRVRDAALPLEEKQPKVHKNIEEFSEYSGKFKDEISEKDRQNVDKYLVEQNVITTQPGSVHMDITRVQHYPDYSEISANAQDNTPVLYQGVPFDKGSVDLFMQLEGSKKHVPSTGTTGTDKQKPSKECSVQQKKVMQTGQSSILKVLMLNQEHDYSMQAGKFDQIIQSEDFDVIEKDEFDIYLPQRYYQSPERRSLDSSIPRVHQTQPVDTNVGTFHESAYITINVAPNHPSRCLKTNISTVQQSKQINTEITTVVQNQQIVSHRNIWSLQSVQESK